MRPGIWVSKQNIGPKSLAQEARSSPCAVDPVLEVKRDAARVEVMVSMDESELGQLSLEFAKAVNVDSGCSIVRKGPRHHGPVLESRGLAVDGWCLGWRFVGAWWREIAQPGLVVVVTSFVGDGEHLFDVVL